MKHHLFIGLGGQGGKSLAELRKVIEQRQADVRFLKQQDVSWDFLYIDSSLDVTNERQNWIHFGKNLALAPADFVHIKDRDQNPSAASLKQRPDIAPWIGDPTHIEKFLKGATNIRGANQRRRFGRLLFASQADGVRNAIISGKVRSLTAGRTNQCCFHIFASLAGGTGSGCIVDLVALLRAEYPNCSLDNGFAIILYLYVTSSSFKDAEVGYFHQNQFAALRDLNAMACGRLSTHLLGNHHGGKIFSHNEPINEIVLSSSLNDQNQNLSIQHQHRIISESAFERVFCYCSGNLNADQQKALTGEDVLASFSGEPNGRPQRSYRFATIGMRRWKIPTEEVQDLLANDLYVSSFRQMLYENWHDGEGYRDVMSNTMDGAMTRVLEELRRHVARYLVKHTDLPALAQSLKTDFDRTFQGLRVEGFKDKDLGDVESMLQTRYRNHIREAGIDFVFNEFVQKRPSRMAALISEIHMTLKNAWLDSAAPLGLAYVPGLLITFQDEVRRMVRQDHEADTGHNSQLKSRIDARRVEWTKITYLSAAFGKRGELADGHRKDMFSLLVSELNDLVAEEDRKFLTALIGDLAVIGQRYGDAAARLRGFETTVKDRRDILLDGLRNLQGIDSANKYELDFPALERFANLVRTNQTTTRNTAEIVRRVIEEATTNETLASIKDISDSREETLWEKLDGLCYPRVMTIHNEMHQLGLTDPILGLSLLDRLQAEHGRDVQAFTAAVREFKDLATSCTRIERNQTQPAVLEGGGHGIPSMPRRMLVLGLPRKHVFSAKMDSIIQSQLTADEKANIIWGTYFHEDPSQIRLLVIDTWMAARFALVVTELEKAYTNSLAQNTNGDIAYFTNIDPGGQTGHRPAILLPSPEKNELLLRAELWLGQHLYYHSDYGAAGNKILIQSNESGVYVVTENKDGVVPERLGDSFKDVVATADIRRMSRIHDSITTVLSRMNEDGINNLREIVRREDERMMEQDGGGAIGKSYVEWTKLREEIYNLFSQ